MTTVDLPMVGSVDKKWVWIGGGTVAAFVAWAYYRRSQSGPTVLEEQVDGNDFLTDDGYGNVPGRTQDSNGEHNDEVIDTIAEWTADVVQKLAITDWDPGFVYSTVGKWIAGEGLTEAEKNLVRAAIAASGQPPGGPYPIKTAQPNPNPDPDPDPDPDPPRPDPPRPDPGPSELGAPHEVNLYDWSAPYGGFVKLFGNFQGDPTALNPFHRKYMRWDGPAGSTKVPKFWSGWSGRNPPLGIPPVRVR